MRNNSKFKLRFSLRWLLLALIPCGILFYEIREYLDSRPPDWQQYSKEKLEAEVRGGKTVVVHVYGDYFYEGVQSVQELDSPEIGRYFRRNDVVGLRLNTQNFTSATAKDFLGSVNHHEFVIAVFKPGKTIPSTICGRVSRAEIINVIRPPEIVRVNQSLPASNSAGTDRVTP